MHIMKTPGSIEHVIKITQYELELICTAFQKAFMEDNGFYIELKELACSYHAEVKNYD